METLRIKVSFETEQAVQNAKQLVTAQQEVTQEVKKVDEAIKSAEGATAALAGTTKALGDAHGTTGREIKTTTEEVRKVDTALVQTAASAEDAAKGLTKAGTAGHSAADGVKAVGTEAKKTSEQVEKVGTKSKDAAEKAKSEFDKLTAPATAMTGIFKGLAGGVGAWLSSFAGIGAIVGLIEKMKSEMTEIEGIRNRMIAGKQDLDVSLQGFRANLGLPNTAQGQQDTFNLFKELKAANPQAPAEVVMAVAGQSQAFQYDVTKAGNGRDVNSMLTGFAASTQLAPDVAEGLPQIARAMDVKDTKDTRKMLARILALQKNTGIADQSAFMDQFLRLAAPLVPQGMSIEDVGGLLAASALSGSNPRMIGSDALQSMRAVQGKDEDAQAAMGRRALKLGAIKQADVTAAGNGVRDASLKKNRTAIDTSEREAADTQTEIDQLPTAAKLADAKEAQQRKAAKGDKEKLAIIDQEHAARVEANADKLRNLQQKLDDQKGRAQKLRADADAAGEKAGLAAAYRKLTPSQQLNTVRQATAAMSVEERKEVFSQELKGSLEEVNALSVMTGPGGRQAFAAAHDAAAAVTDETAKDVDRDIEGYRQSPIARRTQSTDNVRLKEYAAVTTEEEEQLQFRKASESRADILNKNRQADPNLDTGIGARAMTNDQRKLAVYASDIQRTIFGLIRSMSKEEREAHPEIAQLIEQVQYADGDLTAEGTRASLDGIYRKFVAARRQLAAERQNGKYKTRTEAPATGVYMKSRGFFSSGHDFAYTADEPGVNAKVGTLFDGKLEQQGKKIDAAAGGSLQDPGDSAPIIPGGPTPTINDVINEDAKQSTQQQSGPAAPATQPSASAAGGNVTIHIGQVITNTPIGDLPGRLEGVT